MKIVDSVRSLLEKPIGDMGYELYDIDYAKEPEGFVLTIYIDSPNGITLDGCEKVSRAVDPLLDEHDPISGAYYLSVSSVGLDRPFKLDKDFARNLGADVDIKLYAPIEGSRGEKSITCKLEAFDAENITVLLNGESKTIPRKSLALVRLHINF